IRPGRTVRAYTAAGRYCAHCLVSFRSCIGIRDCWSRRTSGVLEEDMEYATVSRLVRADGLALLTVRGLPDRPGIAARLFRAVADSQINVLEIVQNVSIEGNTDISFVVDKVDANAAFAAVQLASDSQALHTDMTKK